MQSRLFTKKAIKMSARGSILEAFGDHFGALLVPSDTPGTSFGEIKILMQKKGSEVPFGTQSDPK